MTNEEYEAIIENNKKQQELLNACPNPECNSTDVYVKNYGITGTLGHVKCSLCDTYVRDWDAY